MKLLLNEHGPRKSSWLPLSLHLPKTYPQQFLGSPGENWNHGSEQEQAGPGSPWEEDGRDMPNDSLQEQSINRGSAGQPTSLRCQPAGLQRLLSGPLQSFLCFLSHPWRQVISRASWQLVVLGTAAREPGACLPWLQPCLTFHIELYSATP